VTPDSRGKQPTGLSPDALAALAADIAVRELMCQLDEARADADRAWGLLGDLLDDVDNWGCSPSSHYEAMLAEHERRVA
jgi:hypothetical protein